MTFLITALILGLCFTGMAIGLIVSKKELRKGCSDDPEGCACRNKGIDPADFDNK